MKLYHVAHERTWQIVLKELEEAKDDVVNAVNNGFSQKIVDIRKEKQRMLQKEMERLWAKSHGMI